MLGLIFLKYLSDAFEERQKALREQFQNPDHDAPSMNTSSASSPRPKVKKAASTTPPKSIVTLIVEMLQSFKGRSRSMGLFPITPFNRLSQLIDRHGVVGAVIVAGDDIKIVMPQPVFLARVHAQTQKTESRCLTG